MTFGESYLPTLGEKERERVIATFFPKPTLWSEKIMVRVIEQKILGIQDLLRCRVIAHRTHAQKTDMHENCTECTQAAYIGIT